MSAIECRQACSWLQRGTTPRTSNVVLRQRQRTLQGSLAISLMPWFDEVRCSRTTPNACSVMRWFEKNPVLQTCLPCFPKHAVYQESSIPLNTTARATSLQGKQGRQGLPYWVFLKPRQHSACVRQGSIT